MKKGPCAKQTTVCVIVDLDTGDYWIGDNYCNTPQKICPREGMQTGQGYELCKQKCGQRNHAEVNAADKVKKKIANGIAYLLGHYYACDNCKKALQKVGIAKIICVMPEESIRRGDVHKGVHGYRGQP